MNFQQTKLDAYNPKLNSTELSWNSDEKFSFYLHNIAHLPQLKDYDKIFFKIAIYHGQDRVSSEIYTDKLDNEKSVRDASISINKVIETNIKVKNLHRCSKLCICLYAISKKKKKSRFHCAG